MVTVTMKELLEAGVHFGHQVRRWNPKMKEFIFGERNGIYIIDLQKTQKMFRDAIAFVTSLMSEDRGRTVLFVGTKRQAQDAIREEAERAGMYYINSRWLGGLLTNFQTIQKSIKRLKDLESMQTDGRYEKMTKKERIKLDRERESLTKNLAGIKSMTRLPDIVFIIDVRKEEIAVAEANRLGIPVVAVVDTNCSPEGVDYVIPGNDDALRAVRLFASRIADAVLEGQQMGTEGGEDAEGGAQAEATAETDSRPRRASASADNTSSVTTSVDPGREAANATDMNAAAPSTETQTSVPGNQGFGRTGQQPDSVGDHPQAGTNAPVPGASGAGENKSELQPESSPEADKGAESVGVGS
ncbi:MAG TPA: 30S ribosomal protein S2 [Pyrinomonadaceae bacterium]|nr:30S ribosomal protein S2 [Pyrinomonadaceae bacterium]